MKHYQESHIQAQIVQALQAADIYCFSVPNEASGNNPGRQAWLKTMGLKSGVADLVALLPERVVFLEVKSRKGRQTASQAHFQELCEILGHQYAVVRSVEDALEAVGGVRGVHNSDQVDRESEEVVDSGDY